MDQIELWITEQFGEIATDSVEFEQFNTTIWAASVGKESGSSCVAIGPTRRQAIHGLYMLLATRPMLKPQLNDWWLLRLERILRRMNQER